MARSYDHWTDDYQTDADCVVQDLGGGLTLAFDPGNPDAFYVIDTAVNLAGIN